jgi:hypothetical protein
MSFPLETLPPVDPIGGVVYLRIILSPEEASRIYGIPVIIIIIIIIERERELIITSRTSQHS